jgi:hypothetical protein
VQVFFVGRIIARNRVHISKQQPLALVLLTCWHGVVLPITAHIQANLSDSLKIAVLPAVVLTAAQRIRGCTTCAALVARCAQSWCML